MTDPRGRHVTLRKPEETGDPHSMHHGGSFKKYMQFKNQKLREQFKGDAAEAPSLSNLFAGVHIHVNGFANPTHQELRQIMALHGGTFEVYYSKSRVTHIICSNLPNAKIKAIEKERTSTPIVRPEWIVDSLQAGRLLSHEAYALWRLRDRPGQATLSAFKPQPVNRTAATESNGITEEFHQPAAVFGANSISTLFDKPDRRGEHWSESAKVGTDAQSRDSAEGLENIAGSSCEAQAAEGMGNRGGDGWQSSLEEPMLESNLEGPATSVTTGGSAKRPAQGPPRGSTANDLIPTASIEEQLERAQQIAAECRASCDLLKGAPKSSREDPKFMANYYKSSRLHFIGTWKARIEALTAETSGGKSALKVPKRVSGYGQRSILHLDMDCFFASVAALTDPSLKGLPLAVCHSNSAQGTGEISSANYEARAYGITAVMCIGEAKRLCPSLVVMPYQYDKYQAISEQVYKILLEYTSILEPISCDEAFLDVTGLGDPEKLAASIRGRIAAETGCTASAGISHNKLLARLATKAGKPNGQHRLTIDQVDRHLLQLDVDALPGVGWSTRQRLEGMEIRKVEDLRRHSKEALQRDFGSKHGAMIWDAAQGHDEREVEPMKIRRSVGAEVNWGIRFTSEADADSFLDGLAGEVHNRLLEAGVKGRCISVKIKRRKINAPEPIKFLGHGPCDNISRSVTINRFTDSMLDLAKEARALLRALRIPATEIRGIGISVTKLDNDPASAVSGPGRGGLPRAAPSSATAFRPFQRADIGTSEVTKDNLIAAAKADGPLAGSKFPRLNLLPESLQRLANPEKEGQPNHSASSPSRPLQKEPQPSIPAVFSKVPAEHSSAADLCAQNAADRDEEEGRPWREFPVTAESAIRKNLDTRLAREANSLQHGSGMAAENTNDLQAGSSFCREGDNASQRHMPAIELKEKRVSVEAQDATVGTQKQEAAGGESTPILALPPASQVDASVLDALPLHLKREYERAYGIGILKSPPNKGKRKRIAGANQVADRPAKRHFPAVLPAAKPQPEMGLTPSRVDLEVLKELPMEMQLEIAADMSRASKVAAIKPMNTSSFDLFPANPTLQQNSAAQQQDPRGSSLDEKDEDESPRQFWPALKAALETIAKALTPIEQDESERSLGADGREQAKQQLEALGEIVMGPRKRFAEEDLEGLQYLARHLERTACKCPCLAGTLREWRRALENAVADAWGGKRIKMESTLSKSLL